MSTSPKTECPSFFLSLSFSLSKVTQTTRKSNQNKHLSRGSRSNEQRREPPEGEESCLAKELLNAYLKRQELPREVGMSNAHLERERSYRGGTVECLPGESSSSDRQRLEPPSMRKMGLGTSKSLPPNFFSVATTASIA